jgi:iron complex outermembrane receptor protein
LIHRDRARAANGPASAREAPRLFAAALALALALGGGAVAQDPPTVEQLRVLSIQELADVQVYSVFRRAEPLHRTPASVYVITREEIRRAGARSLAEALRLAPHLEVARRSARDYAVSARGFNYYQLSNKLLVLVDGRSLYTPLHAGVFWDQQQVMLDDIDRIEVISGPGGTAWGVNAVNGVINVITRDARETVGGLASLELGTSESRAGARWGGELAGGGAWRAYGLGARVGETVTAGGDGRGDDWDGGQVGFRADWGAGEASLKLQGDLYRNSGADDITLDGGNLIGRWLRRRADGSSLLLRSYFDLARRDSPGVRDRLETFDVEGVHSFRLGDHQLVWGGGARFNRNEFVNRTNSFRLDPEREDIYLANLFLEDSVAVGDSLVVTAGAKVEHSSYTGAELLPSLRLAWERSDTDFVWAAVSRAARAPSRIDRDLQAPGILEKAGESFESERLVAYELGYRGRPGERTSFSLTLYHHDYDDLRVLEIPPATGRLRFGNAHSGTIQGVEAWADYRASARWRLAGGADLIDKDLELEPGAVPIALEQHQGDDPEYQAFLRSSFDLSADLELDLVLRRIGSLPAPEVPAYTALDLRLGWRRGDGLELWVAGRNLLDSQHAETGRPEERGEIVRSGSFGVRARF